MNILFLLFHGFSESSGISKKIHYQIKGLRDNGHKVYVCTYDYLNDGSRVRMIDEKNIQKFGKGRLAAFRKRIKYGSVIHFVLDNSIDFVYCRSFHNANPFTIKLFKAFKLNGVKSVIEIPTYPYDQEYVGFGFRERLGIVIDRIFRRNLAQQISAFVTFTDDTSIFGQRTIRISNGIDFDSIPLKKQSHHRKNEFHMIGVAEVHYWHGYDRMIRAIGEYYKNESKKKFFFHIVGGVGTEMHNNIHSSGFHELIEQYNLSDNIIFYGQKFGLELDAIFDKCDFAIGSLARHRSGITKIKTLKNREYAARGIPFMYSEDDDDFDSKPYIIKASADESHIDINRIITFYSNLIETPNEIRNSIKNLSWKKQMKIVIDEV